MMKEITDILFSLIGPGVVLLFLVLFLIINGWFFKRMRTIKESAQITKQTISILIILVGTLTFILSLPMDKGLKGQILSFLAIRISSSITLSSTTVLGNLIA